MKKYLVIFLSIILISSVVMSINGCAEPSAPAEPPQETPQPSAPTEIRIGDTVSFTGIYAGFGVNAFGVKAAVEDINKQGGIYVEEYGKKLPVRWITADVQSDPLKVAPLTEDLILREKVHFLGPHLEAPPMRLGTAQMAEKYKIPAVYGVGPIENWMAMQAASDVPWTYSWTYGFALVMLPEPPDFRANDPGYSMMATFFGAMAEYSVMTNKKIAVFAADDADGKGWYQAFTGASAEQGYECYGADKEFGIFPSGTTDFTPIITEWIDAGCEILWGNCPGPDYGILWKQCHTQGFKPKLVFATRAAGLYYDVKAWGGDLPNGVLVELFWNQQVPGVGIGDTTPQSLFDRFFEETGQPLNQGIGYDYMGAQILFDAIERAGTLDPDAVVKAISETDLETINGRAVFEIATRFHRWPVSVGQWQKTDNPWVWEEPVVFSNNDFLQAMGELIFPMPYD